MSDQSISEKRLNLKPILDISLDTELKQLRVRSVRPGKDKPTAILAIYSSERGVDPWREAFFFPKDTLKLALFTDKGEMLWRRDLRPSVMPGARSSHGYTVMDLNDDGVDEVLWGERCIELDKGTELFCADRDVYHGHSDVVQPFHQVEEASQ